ncbi:MAG: hypothetical protein KF800_13585 [Lysobacter sp.]|nr:hypothetical protein [Lysobacter sp.]
MKSLASEEQAMQARRCGMQSGLSRGMCATIGIAALLAAAMAGTSLAKDRPPRLPKGVEVLRLPDGSHALTAKVSSPLPTGEQVPRVDPGVRLEEAARLLCPQGHEMTREKGAKLRIVSGRVVVTETANVRCAHTIDATTPPPADAA